MTKKVATLVLDEDADVNDIEKIVDDRLESFNNDVRCICNYDGTYDIVRTDL